MIILKHCVQQNTFSQILTKKKVTKFTLNVKSIKRFFTLLPHIKTNTYNFIRNFFMISYNLYNSLAVKLSS